MSSGQLLNSNTHRNTCSYVSSFPGPVLIADKSSAVLEAIASELRTSMPGIALNLCSSHSYAMHTLTTACYQVVLFGAQFSETGNFLLLKQHRACQPGVPILLVAERQERDLVQRALEQEDVEDIVVWPLLRGQVKNSVQDGMCLYRTRLTMADRRKRLALLRSDQSLPPKEARRAIRQIEANVKDLARVVHDCERDAQRRAIEHFDLLGRSEQEISHS